MICYKRPDYAFLFFKQYRDLSPRILEGVIYTSLVVNVSKHGTDLVIEHWTAEMLQVCKMWGSIRSRLPIFGVLELLLGFMNVVSQLPIAMVALINCSAEVTDVITFVVGPQHGAQPMPSQKCEQ